MHVKKNKDYFTNPLKIVLCIYFAFSSNFKSYLYVYSGKRYEPKPYVVPLPRSPTPPAVQSPTKGKGKKAQATPEPAVQVN